MSAEKCGDPIAVVLSSPKIMSEGRVIPDEVFLSTMAVRVLRKIRYKYPNFYPIDETDLWMKAYQMGLVEEE